jgi:hypothetical protein
MQDICKICQKLSVLDISPRELGIGCGFELMKKDRSLIIISANKFEIKEKSRNKV